jgi:hypothetical protein
VLFGLQFSRDLTINYFYKPLIVIAVSLTAN